MDGYQRVISRYRYIMGVHFLSNFVKNSAQKSALILSVLLSEYYGAQYAAETTTHLWVPFLKANTLDEISFSWSSPYRAVYIPLSGSNE